MSQTLSSIDHTLFRTLRRNGDVVPFEPAKIALALQKAFLADSKAGDTNSSSSREKIAELTRTVVNGLTRSRPQGGAIHIEDIQDQVELALMRAGEHDVARAYVLYREKRALARAAHKEAVGEHIINVKSASGKISPLDLVGLRTRIENASHGLKGVNIDVIFKETLKNAYDGIPETQVFQSAIMSSRAMIERDPVYNTVTANLLMDVIRLEIWGELVAPAQMSQKYVAYFPEYIRTGIRAELLDEELGKFDLVKLGAALKAERDSKFTYLGLQTLYDRYFLHIEDTRIEMPQAFFMRVAMGLALNEANREERAIEFYNVLSSFDFMSSTPTLFNSGTRRSQLSSCYLTTVSDDLDGIYEAIKENALLSKFAGGLGNDWTAVRSLGSRIKGTNGKSQGVVPFLKVVNDTAVAVNQGGKRKGAVCAYLETWHADIEEFLELRKNVGDDRRRTHDMNTANWIPDLFMKRVIEDGPWTLFTPSECPDLHETYGKEFEALYTAYEAKAARKEMKLAKVIPAKQLWRKMLGMLFETGHPWFTFKDPCNIRSPQQHVGVVHSSNLCTEITLNTSVDEIAVCNLGSVNLVAHMKQTAAGKWVLDADKVSRTVAVAMRMLDNVVDVNFYAVEKARNSNLKHRPVGMGIMGFQDCLHIMKVPFASQEAVEFADVSMELVAYHAYLASSKLAKERGAYQSYEGSLWSKGILPQDTVAMLEQERGSQYLVIDTSSQLDWTPVREHIATYGMRNSNCLAIAPTATISNIIGVSACIEPSYQNLYVKSNLAGEFTVVNDYMVADLKALDLWDEVMVSDLKYYDGSVSKVDRVPAELKAVYATAFEVPATWVIQGAARRQKWLDQAQSLNIYIAGASGTALDETYKEAWLRGLKTTYYLRTLGASSAEKSTGKGGELNAVSAHGAAQPAPAAVATPVVEVKVAPVVVPVVAAKAVVADAELDSITDGPACFLRPGDPGFEECEACQ